MLGLNLSVRNHGNNGNLLVLGYYMYQAKQEAGDACTNHTPCLFRLNSLDLEHTAKVILMHRDGWHNRLSNAHKTIQLTSEKFEFSSLKGQRTSSNDAP